MTTLQSILLRVWVSLFIQLALCTYSKSEDIQSLLNRGGAVILPSGTHVVAPLKVPAGVTSIDGTLEPPTVLKLAPNSGDGARIIYISHTGAVNRSIAIRNVRVDMNRGAQGWDGAWNRAQQAALFFTAERATSRLAVQLDNVEVRNSAGNGVYVNHAVDADIHRLRAYDVHVGGLVMNGHRSKTVATCCRFVGCGPEIEPNNVVFVVEASLSDIVCSDFDIALKGPGCKFTAQYVTHNGPILYGYCHPQSQITVRDSTFVGRYAFRLAGNSTFERCGFSGPPGNTQSVMSVLWSHGALASGQAFTLRDCVINGPGSIGIDAGIDSPANGNQLSILNTSITGTTKGAAAQAWSNGTQRRGLPWILTGSTHNGEALK